MFQLLGVGIGAAGVDLTGRYATSGRAMGTGAAIWWLVTGLISLFIGGWVAGRLNWLPSRLDRALHGFTVWGLFYVVMFLATTSALGALLGGTASLLGKTISATGQVASSPQGQQAAQQGMTAMGLSPDAIREEVTGTEGRTMDPQASQRVASAVTDYFRGDKTPQERQNLAQALSQATGRNETEANQMIDRLEKRQEQAKETAQAAVNVTGKTFIGLAISLFLGAIASILGSLASPAPQLPTHYEETPHETRTETGAYAGR